MENPGPGSLDLPFVLLTDELSDEDSDLEVEGEEDTSDEESLNELLTIIIKKATERDDFQKIPRIENYLENTIIKYNTHQFKSHFRMFPDTFEYVLSLIHSNIVETGYVAGRKPIDPKKQLLIALWMMATPDCYRSVCEKFDVGLATALRSVRRVSHALHSLAPQFIRWPSGEHAKQVAREFEKYSAFPRVVGAIDGTHIKINSPSVDAQSYINRKGTHSIQVQAVCTRNMVFTSVFAGYAGSVHDARVFRLSPILKYIQNPQIYFEGDTHLVGDAAYGIHPNLMVPFKNNGHLTPRQKNFNFCLSSARMSIERAFGLLKCRWRSIKDCLPMVSIKKIPEYILALAVLHNICIIKRDMVPVENRLRVATRGRLIDDGRQLGIAKRQNILNNLMMRSI